MASRVVPVVGGAALGAVVAGQLLGRRSGSTTTERARPLVRNRGWVRPWWVNAGCLALIVPADHVMATGMLRGLKQRVEAAA